MIVWVSDVSWGKGQGRPTSPATLMISPKVQPIQEGNPDSGIQENFTRGMWNPGFWNTESH